MQAFRFTLNPTQTQAAERRAILVLAVRLSWTVTAPQSRHQGVARGWHRVSEAVAAGVAQTVEHGQDQVCVNAQTGQVWWRNPKEALCRWHRGRSRCSIGTSRAACQETGWQNSRRSRFKKEGTRRRSRVLRPVRCVWADRLTLPVIGTIRTYWPAGLGGSSPKGRARVLAITVRRNGTRLDASVRVLV